MEDNLSEIIEIFSSTTDKREMRSLFEDVFTDAEREDIAKRWYIFKELYKARYELASVRLIDDFDGDDARSMAANNTSCFNFRRKTSGSSLSAHATGMAVDINPLQNPYVKGEEVEPESAREYGDRTVDFPHKITPDDLCCKLFRSRGFQWGGAWNSVKDYQHFEKKQ